MNANRKHRIDRTLALSALAAGALAAVGCQANPFGPKVSKVEAGNVVIAAPNGQNFFVFDAQGVEVFGTSESDGGLSANIIANGVTETSAPPVSPGAPSTSSVLGNRAVVAFGRQAAVLDVLESSVIWRAHLLEKAPTAVGISKSRLAFVAGSQVTILGAERMNTLLRADLKAWLSDHDASEFRLVQPLDAGEDEAGSLLLISYARPAAFSRKAGTTLVQIARQGVDGMPASADYNDPLPGFEVQACSHDGDFAYAAGRIAVPEGEKTVDHLVVQKWSTTNLTREEILRIRWPERPHEDGSVRVADLRHLTVRGGTILLVHEDGSLLAFDDGRAAFPAGDPRTGVSSAAVLSDEHLVALSPSGDLRFPALTPEP